MGACVRGSDKRRQAGRDVGYAVEGGWKVSGMPRLRSDGQGYSGPCKGPCFENVIEAQRVVMVGVAYLASLCGQLHGSSWLVW
jgi:hypothetical protein